MITGAAEPVAIAKISEAGTIPAEETIAAEVVPSNNVTTALATAAGIITGRAAVTIGTIITATSKKDINDGEW